MDYYQILGVPRTASTAEIKSAYRRLARQRHPDLNEGSHEAAEAFSVATQAHRILTDSGKRALYDARFLKSHKAAPYKRGAGGARYTAYKARAAKLVQHFVIAEREDTQSLQESVYPLVALLFSAFFGPLVRPRFWAHSGAVIRFVLVILFLLGLWLLISRISTFIKRYTYQAKSVEPFVNPEPYDPNKLFPRYQAYLLITAGPLLSFGLGLLIGMSLQDSLLSAMPMFFAGDLHPELLLYPPIVVLIVDTLHAIATRIDI